LCKYLFFAKQSSAKLRKPQKSETRPFLAPQMRHKTSCMNRVCNELFRKDENKARSDS